LFADPAQKSAAYSEQNNESVFYRQVVATTDVVVNRLSVIGL
jgi:hypothetical protein